MKIENYLLIVLMSAVQSPKQSPKKFNTLEELGFLLSDYIKSKHPLQDGANFMTVHDDVFNADFDIKRKDSKILVSKHKVPRKAPKTPKTPKAAPAPASE